MSWNMLAQKAAQAEAKLAPWAGNPYGLVSLWEMLARYAHLFYELGESLHHLRVYSRELSEIPDRATEERLRSAVFDVLPIIRKRLTSVDLELSIKELDRWTQQSGAVDEPLLRINQRVTTLRDRITDELEERRFLYVDPLKAKHYDDFRGPWEKASDRFVILTDIEEAEKSYALGRCTACVFHLMRIMELGVQELGSKFGVANAPDKLWGDITNEIGQKVKAMPRSTSQETQVQAAFAEAVLHLDHVRFAWRNPTMHPKQTYTDEEARDALEKVRVFMNHLSRII